MKGAERENDYMKILDDLLTTLRSGGIVKDIRQ
ncbi:unnamed protein product, partial [marine sediment metagenome]